MSTLLQDVRYGLRTLARSPGFTAAAVLSLTLGIGANTAIFTFAKAIFLQPIPVANPARVMALYSTAQDRSGSLQQYMPTPYPNAMDYRRSLKSFSGVAIAIPAGFGLTVAGKTTPVFTELVTPNFFDVLGVHPFLGRWISKADDAAARPVAVLSYALWNTRFAADRAVLGRTIQLDQTDYTVIGVAPRDFRNVGNLGSPAVWAPASLAPTVLTGIIRHYLFDRGFRLTMMVGRLAPGVTVAQAQAEVHAMGLRLQQAYPKDNAGRNEMVVPVNDTAIPPQLHHIFALAGILMMGIVGLVLLIACANVANLLLARAAGRRREIAIRLALGASRLRLIRQLLTESFLIALLAGVFGVLCAYWARPALLSLMPAFLRQQLDFSLDGRVFAFTFGLAVLATLLFGLAPALQASRNDTIDALKDRSAASSGAVRWYGLRGVLVIVQVALSLVALVGAGLFIHSLRNARAIDPGFEVQHEIVMFVNPGAEHYARPQAEALYHDLIRRLDALPMVAGASLSDTRPFGGGLERTTFTDGVDTTDPRNGKLTPVENVAPGFFSAAGITMLRGRGFAESDDAKGQMVAVVNQAAARAFWPGRNPIGQHLHFLGEPWVVTVVGEVRTVKYLTLGESPQPIVYMPLAQHYAPAVVLYVRTKGDPTAVVPDVRSVLRTLAPSVPLTGVSTVEQLLSQSLTAPRIGAELLGGFGLLALILAAIGTYGTMSYSVTQRTNEIGIRLALGAQPGGIVRLILANGMTVVLAAVCVGLPLSLLLTKSMGALLYGIGMFDAASFFATAGLLILVALVACYIPARRSLHTDVVATLRSE